MSKHNLILLLLIAAVFLATTGIPTISGDSSNGQEIIVGRNINMVAGTQLPKGDPWLQRQNEPSIAVSTRNPLHLLAGANDYRTVDWPIPNEEIPGFEKTSAARDAWLGVFKSFDGGQSWISALLPGFPQDTSIEGASSPLFGLTAATDPTVRAGTNGLFFYSGIAFERAELGRSVVFVSRYIDNNNKEKGDPIKYLDSQIIAEGTGRQFIDKPWIATDIPRTKKPKIVMIDGQAIPKSNVYLTYSTFLGDFAEDIHSKVYFAISEDCGANWFNPVKLSESNQINQGTTIAVDPGTGDIYVAWRRFGSDGESDAILITTSTDGGQKFSKPVKVADITPFDQGTTSASFRSNCFPTIAVDNGGIVYLAWSERGMGPGGEARIVITTSDDGGRSWSIPKKIDSSIDEYEPGHQIMPSLTFADGKLMMIWYDQRDDVSGRFTEFIDDLPGQPRHTLDVRVSKAAPGIDPQFAPSKRISRYLYILTGEKYNYNVQQIQFNFVNYPLFKQGTVPFIGDYMDIAPSPMFILDESGEWRYNTESTDSTVFHAAWTDNRDVRPPPDGLWTDYSPPSSIQEDPNFYTDNSCTEWTKTGMRNQNIYTARITEGIVVGSPGNTKPLGTLGETPEGEPIPRAFVVIVKNTTAEIRCFRLTIVNQPPDAPPSGEGKASFLEFEFLDWMDVKVAPFSSVSRTVFVHSADSKATVRVSVDEIDAPGGGIIEGGLASYVLLNPDIQNPDIQNPDIQNPDIQNPDIQNFEVHNPDIQNWYVNPDIMNPDIQNPDIMNPDIQNPDIMNPDIMNPDIMNPDIQNPDIMNPDIQNPDIMNPDIMNPDIMNTTIADPSAGEFVDVIWELQNIGNTTSSYIFRTISTAADEEGNLPEGIQAQLLVYRVYSTPAEYDTQNNPCDLGKQEHHELILNIINPDIMNPDIQNMDFKTPDIQNPDIQNATFSLEPEGEAKVVLRLWRPYNQSQTASRGLSARETLDFSNPDSLFESFGSFLSSTSGNTTERQEGIPTVPSDSSFFMITTKVLDPGEVGVTYSDFLEAAGGERDPEDPNWDYTWTIVGGDLPPGLQLNPLRPGQICGTPTNAGTYSFTAQVTDFEGQACTKDLWITIRPSGAQVYTISGRVSFGGTGLPGVEMVGLPGNPITDSAGYYSGSVPPGWSGTVEPWKEEFIFDPPAKYYDSVNSDLTTHYIAYDITPPIVTVADPDADKTVDNASYLIQGTASDIGSGLASVEVSIDDGATWALAPGTSSWAYSATLAPGANVIKARATDNSGNVSAPTPGVTLTFDALSPTVATVTTPSHENYYNASTMPATFQGVAADDGGGCGLNANSTQFYIQNSDDNYWDGSTWVSGIQWLATSHAATTNGTQTSWTDAVDLPAWTDGICFTKAKATDKAGNSYEGSEITFYYDSTGTYFLDHFDFDTISSPQIAGVAFSITITAKDSSGNTIPTYEGTNTLSDTTGTINPTTTPENFTAGVWTGEVTISSTQLGETITTAGGGKEGTSDIFDVVAPLEITMTSLPDAVKDFSYSSFLQATGVPPLTWSLADGSSLPSGLSLNPATGEISGTPTVSGNFNFTVKVTDAIAQFDSQDLSLTVVDWVARYNGPGDAEDYTLDIAVDLSGNVYVTGYSMGEGTGRDYATAKYDSSGNLLWISRYDGAVSGHDLVSAITLDSLGNVYVTGESYGSGTGPDYVTIKYDNSGAQQWIARYYGLASLFEDSSTDIAVDSSGNVYVTGYSVGDGAGLDYATVKYDSSGQELWVARYDGGISDDRARAIAVDTGGNVYVTGESSGNGTGSDYATVKYDSSGQELWVARYDGLASSWDFAKDIAVDLSGNVYVTGYSAGSGTDNDYATVKYDSSGTQLWVARYDGPAHGDDGATSISLDSTGNIYVTGGSSGNGTGSDYATVKYDSSGQELWVARYDGPKNELDAARAVSVDPEENVYVTGQSLGIGTAFDYATLKYDSSGTQLWVARYDGPFSSHDVAYAIALDSLGNVLVTGGCAGSSVYMDYATVKYSQSFPSTLIISTETLDNGYSGIPYAATVWAFGGSGSRTWSVPPGYLPPGLNLDANTGIISGTPATAGTYNFTVQVIDGALSDTQALSITIIPGAATQVELFGPESVEAGSVSGVFTLKSQDSFGNGVNVEGDTVFNLSSTSGGTAIFSSDAAGLNQITQVTITNGESFATFYYKDTQAGDQTVTATYSSGPIDLGSDSHLVTITAAAASQLAFTQSPAGCTAGEMWIQQPVVEVQDLYNNAITSNSSTQITLAIDNNPSGGTLSGTTTVTVIAGVATFADLSIDEAGAGYALKATSVPIYTSATSNAFDINAQITGIVLYNEVPVTNQTNEQAAFFVFDENSNQELQGYTPEYNTSNGIFAIKNVPPGQYSISVNIDAALPQDGKPYPGDFRGYHSGVTVSVGQEILNQDLVCIKLMHLTSPIDNNNAQNWPPPYDEYLSLILFQWDGVIEATSYRIKVDKYQSDPYSYVENVVNIPGITDVQYSLPLLLSEANQHYQFELRAYNEMNWIGGLTIVYTSGYGSDYRFRVTSPAAASQVELTGPASVGAGSVSGEFTLESQDSAGNPSNVTADTVFDLSSTSGGYITFYSDAGGTIGITQVTIFSGQSSATFYYKEFAAGVSLVTATWASGGADLGSDSHEISVIAAPASQVVLTGPAKAGGGFISEALTLESQDGLGNPSNVTADTVFDLSSNSGGIATFYSDSEGTNEITQVTIPSGQSSASFYYEDAVVGTPTVTATFNTGPMPLGSDDHQITVWAVVGQIAFASDRDGNWEIYVMNADGLGQTRLTNNSTVDYQPSWSRDGSKIVFLSNRDGNDEIYVMNADGSWQTNLTNNSANDQFPSWSPDGSEIVFASNRSGFYEIYVMNADGSAQTRLTNISATDLSPSWSPDGSKIAFQSNRDGNYEIYVMNADGSAQTRLTDHEADDRFPSWSPDGSKIAFQSNRDGNYEIYVMNADGSAQTHLTDNTEEDKLPSWSPDGSKLTFQSNRDGNYEIYVMNADGSAQTRLTNNTDADYTPNWGGAKIAFTSTGDGNYEIYIMNADGSGQMRLTDNSSIDRKPSWSPEGTKIAFMSDRDGNYEIYFMNADGSGQTNLTNNSTQDLYPSWSPGGTKIAFTSDRDGNDEIYVMNADGSGQTNLTNNSTQDLYPSWSPDGSKIAFMSNRDGNWETYVMNADGSGLTRLTTNSSDDLVPSWSPDGSKIAFTSDRDINLEIYIMNADGSGQTNLTNNSASDLENSWSPDGTKIAFTSNRDGNDEIYVMNADGTGQTRLTTNSWSDREPSWRPQPNRPETYEFDTKWGSYGSGDGQFLYPYYIAVDSSGNVYVVDRDNHRIQKFSSSGVFNTKWGSRGTGDGQFSYPQGIAVDSSGYVYVADTGNHRIQKFSSSGVFVTRWGSYGTGDGQFYEPFGIAVDSSEYVYVADTGNHRIQKFSSSGDFMTKWGSNGTGDGQFSYPYYIAVDSLGYFYVADTGNHRIQKFSSSGDFMTKWGSNGTGDGQFDLPTGIAVDSSGYVYVAGYGNNRIQKFSSSGVFVTKWGSYGTGDGQFDRPIGIAVDSSGNVYVVDRNNHRIQKFRKK